MTSVKCIKCGLVNWATEINCKRCENPIADSIANAVIKANGVNGQLEMTQKSITIKRQGAISFLTQGLKGDKEILISQISSIQFKVATNMLNGYIQFAFIGGREAKGSFLEAGNDENTVMFSLIQQPEFEQFKLELQKRMDRTSSESPSSSSNLDDLEKLASLRDKKIITDDEFDAKKRQILGL